MLTSFCVNLLLCLPLLCGPPSVWSSFCVDLLLCSPPSVWTSFCIHLLLCLPPSVCTSCVYLLRCVPPSVCTSSVCTSSGCISSVCTSVCLFAIQCVFVDVLINSLKLLHNTLMQISVLFTVQRSVSVLCLFTKHCSLLL